MCIRDSATNAVTAIKILDGNVTNTKIGNASVTEAKIGNDAVGQNQLKSLSTLLIKNSAGSVVKTIHGAGA